MNLVRSWPQGQAGPTPVGWSWPGNVLPSRVEGWPAGVVPSSDAEALLESAVAWWDVGSYRAGDRFLRNRGTGGDLLDARLGSSLAANTNDPQYLGVEQAGYVYLPGVAFNFLSVPDSADLSITGNLTLDAYIVMDDWTPGTSGSHGIIAKWLTAGNKRGYAWHVNFNGTMTFYWSEAGTATLNLASNAALTVADGSPLWIRVVFTANDGAGSKNVKFYQSPDGSTWTQVGDTITQAGTTSIYDNDQPLLVGASQSDGTLNPLAAKVYRVRVFSDATQTNKVLEIDCDAITSGAATSFTAITGQTVTVARVDSGRKSVAMPSRANRGAAVMLLGTDDYLACTNNWQRDLINFDHGQSFTVLAMMRLWDSAANAILLSTRSGFVSGLGYALSILTQSSGINRVTFGLGDGTTDVQTDYTQVGWANGAFSTFAGVVDSTTQAIRLRLNNATSASVGVAAVGNRKSRIAFTIGGFNGGSGGAAAEFYAAAIFRRALTAAEVAAISTYYTGRIA